jgi:hypothetical protein
MDSLTAALASSGITAGSQGLFDSPRGSFTNARSPPPARVLLQSPLTPAVVRAHSAEEFHTPDQPSVISAGLSRLSFPLPSR